VVALTGDALVGPVRVGLVQDFAETLLSGVLARFSQLNPDVQLEVRVAGSPELLDLLNGDRLDVVLCMGAADDPHAARVAPMVWHGEPDLAGPRSCRWPSWPRRAGSATRPWRRWSARAAVPVALETPSLSALTGGGRGRPGRHLPHGAVPAPRRADRDGPAGHAPGRLCPPRRSAPHPSIAKLSELIHQAALEL
jgi:DNA-binding transcriptional LysR family regulator